MQLKSRKKSIKSQLALASCSLLQATSQQASASDWDIQTDVLLYTEGTERVSLMEPVINASKEIADDEFVDIKLVYDALTGATPNGAHASSQAQTFTTPSGNSAYTIGPNKLPLNDTFRDIRVSVLGDWNYALNRRTRINWSGSLSSEIDYKSLSAGATLSHDLNQRNTTLTAGLAFSSDRLDPIGSINIPFAPMIRAGSATPQPKGGTESKTTTDLLIGWTQVINRTTLMQLNYSISQASGYLTDPYKILTVIDPATGLPTSNLNADELPYVYEKRPDSRSKNAIFWRGVHHLSEDVINLSYRYYWDDWGVNSHTLDLHYRYELGGGSYLQPHARLYLQSAADFYRHSVTDGSPLPDYASADYRLGEMTSTTIGLKYGKPTGHNQELSMRVELMQQNYSTVGTLVGDQQNQDMTPALQALILQLGYHFYW